MSSQSLSCIVLVFFTSAVPSAAEPEVKGIQALQRHGQTFIIWRDVAERQAGAAFRYSLYRPEKPVTEDNLDTAALCYHGVFNNSESLRGMDILVRPLGGRTRMSDLQ